MIYNLKNNLRNKQQQQQHAQHTIKESNITQGQGHTRILSESTI